MPGWFGRRIAETGNSNSARQTTFDSRLDQIGCEEGERDRHVDFADTALLARGDLFGICCSASDDFIEPTPTAVNSGDPLNVGLRLFRARLPSRCAGMARGRF